MKRQTPAFSLIELMVAMAILAAAATIAIRAVGNVQQQARYDATVRSLNDIQSAIVGPANLRGPDGSAMVSGFVADMGRLPQVLVSASDPLPLQTPPLAGDPFSELLTNSMGLPAFQFLNSTVDPSIVIGVGWQGPYVRLGAGPTYLRDGWGNSFQYIPQPPGSTGSTIASIGAPAGAYANPVGVTLSGNGIGGPYATLSGQVSMATGNDTVGPNTGNPTGPTPNATFSNATLTNTPVTIWVCYFGPSVTTSLPATGSVVAFNVSVSAATNWNFVFAASGPVTFNGATYTSTSATNGVYIDSRITVGPRVLRAYVVPTGSGFAPTLAYAASAPLRASAIGGGQTLSTLILTHYSQ